VRNPSDAVSAFFGKRGKSALPDAYVDNRHVLVRVIHALLELLDSKRYVAGSLLGVKAVITLKPEATSI
jgi:hypothetical protein